jgi:hypothetical protein
MGVSLKELLDITPEAVPLQSALRAVLPKLFPVIVRASVASSEHSENALATAPAPPVQIFPEKVIFLLCTSMP